MDPSWRPARKNAVNLSDEHLKATTEKLPKQSPKMTPPAAAYPGTYYTTGRAATKPQRAKPKQTQTTQTEISRNGRRLLSKRTKAIRAKPPKPTAITNPIDSSRPSQPNSLNRDKPNWATPEGWI